MPTIDTAESNLLVLTAEIVSAHIAHNQLSSSELPGLIASVHATLSGLGADAMELSETKPDKASGAVSVRRSLADPSRIISMIDGKPYASLKRHLAANGMTPNQYRATFSLKADYPMVAPAYAEKRRAIAKNRGFGGKPKVAEPMPEQAPARRRTLKVSHPS